MLVAETTSYTRTDDLAYLAQCIEQNRCCSLVGVSNMGKSTLLRQIQQPEVLSSLSLLEDQQLAFFYIDFNLQLQMTEQGFYELILRTILTEIKTQEIEQSLLDEVEEAYQKVVQGTTEFEHALSFNTAIIALCENWSRRLVLLFDEFDEIYQGLNGRVFLNLRALRDKYRDNLMYITVVSIPLADSRHNTDDGEFAELFAHQVHYLKPLSRADVTKIAQDFAENQGVTFSNRDIQFIYDESGGHPGLLRVVSEIMLNNTVAEVVRDDRFVLNRLDDSDNIRTECAKLWHNVAPERQKALINFVSTGNLDTELEQSLLRKGILVEENGDVRIFGKLFEDFIRRLQVIYNEPKQGILIDIESGEVYIDGQPIEPLTSLEYRLLLLLYGKIDKICDKYNIVEAVWGENYIEEVDDARIEKLVSRLRQKIEPTPSEPKYVVTVRGRGYRLQSK